MIRSQVALCKAFGVEWSYQASWPLSSEAYNRSRTAFATTSPTTRADGCGASRWRTTKFSCLKQGLKIFIGILGTKQFSACF